MKGPTVQQMQQYATHFALLFVTRTYANVETQKKADNKEDAEQFRFFISVICFVCVRTCVQATKYIAYSVQFIHSIIHSHCTAVHIFHFYFN